MGIARQYDSRLDRKLDVTGDLSRAEAKIERKLTISAMFLARGQDEFSIAAKYRDGETTPERIERLRGYIARGMVQG